MKNAIFWALAVVVVVILGLLGYGIYLSVTNACSGFDVATAACTGSSSWAPSSRGSS